jgi:hypothetical protein
VAADLLATWSYTYLWDTMELKWVIMKGLVPDIEVQDSIVCHKIGRIYHTHSHSCECACMHAIARARTQAHTHTHAYACMLYPLWYRHINFNEHFAHYIYLQDQQPSINAITHHTIKATSN